MKQNQVEERGSQKFCSIHNQLSILVDIGPGCNEKFRYCCPSCIINPDKKRQLYNYNDAYASIYLDQQKKKFKVEKEAQLQKNLSILHSLENSIQKLKTEYIQNLDNFTKLIVNHIEDTKSEIWQLDRQLDQIDLDQYLTGQNELAYQNHQAIQRNILYHFYNVTKSCQFDECIRIIENYDVQIIVLPEPQALQNDLLCFEHNQSIIMLDLKEKTQKENRLVCKDCITKQIGPFEKIETVEQIWKKKYQHQSFSQQDEKLSQLQLKILDQNKSLNCIKQAYEQQLSNQQNICDNLLQQVISRKQQLDKVQKKQWNELTRNEILQIVDDISSQKIGSQALLELSNIEEEIFQLENDLKSRSIKLCGYILQIKKNVVDMSLNGPANYQLTQNHIAQLQVCQAVVMNQEQTTLLVGCGNKIYVYNVKGGKIWENQKLEQHLGVVTCLYFMKNSNNFISGSADHSMIIWAFSNKEGWFLKQILEESHQEQIKCLIMNQGEELLISCSEDRLIKFWVKKEKWEWKQTLKGHEGTIHSLCLNDSQNQLVSCGAQEIVKYFDSSKGQIIISQQSKGNDKFWTILQKIQYPSIVYRICFFGNNIIVFPNNVTAIIEIYQLNEKNIFEKKNEIATDNNPGGQDSYHFPLLFNKRKQVLFCKIGNIICIIKRQKQFQVEQEIQFSYHKMSGTVSNDGQYLFTWEEESSSLQVRQQQ